MTIASISGQQKLWGRLVSGLTAFWIVLVAFGAQLVGWGGPLIGLNIPKAHTAVWASVAESVAIGAPLLLLVLLWRTPRYRAMFQSWLMAAGFVLLLAPTRWLFPTQGQLVMILQICASLLYLGLLRWLHWPPISESTESTAPWLALGGAGIFAYPWLRWGALGSPLDLVLDLVAGLLFGRIAGALIRTIWLRSLTLDSRGQVRNLLTGGFVTGITLLILASALSFNGTQLTLMIALPALGWAAIGLTNPPDPAHAAQQWRSLAWLIGLAAALILLFIDPDGMALEVLDSSLRWSFQAAAVSMLIGWLLGLAALLAYQQLPGFRMNAPAFIGLLLVWLVGGVLYFAGGEPGLYGDQIFVILKDQADVSAAASIQNADERRRFVYTTLTKQATTSQADLRQTLDRFGVAYTPYYLVNALEVRGGLLHRLWLSTRPEVDRILPSPMLRPLAEPESLTTGSAQAPTTPQWNLTHIGADKVWHELGITGQGIVIGQSDSGVQFDHPELMASYRGRAGNHNYNWFDPWYGTQAPRDIGGHGTHTLGSVLGKTVGVAPGATWFACANLARNLGNPARYLDCMQFMLAPFPLGGNAFTDGDPTKAANVLNNSWGCPQEAEGCDANALLPAVHALRAAGIFVVASAGNEGPACSTIKDAIALYDDVFSVGALDEFGNLAPFSSTGPVEADGSGRIKPDIVAPGVHVLSSFPGSTYEFEDGTSMAGPHVAGVVALMWSANRNLIGDIDRTEQILIQSATPFTGTLGALTASEAVTTTTAKNDAPTLLDPLDANNASNSCLAKTNVHIVPNNLVGYGMVNAYRAVKLALAR